MGRLNAAAFTALDRRRQLTTLPPRLTAVSGVARNYIRNPLMARQPLQAENFTFSVVSQTNCTATKNDRKETVMPANKQKQPQHADIALRAFELWTKAGKPMGHDQRLWLQAEAELKNGVIAKVAAPAMKSNTMAA